MRYKFANLFQNIYEENVILKNLYNDNKKLKTI